MNNYCSFTKVDKFYIILQMVHLQILVQGNPKCLIWFDMIHKTKND